jgi:hypothetical protein
MRPERWSEGWQALGVGPQRKVINADETLELRTRSVVVRSAE